MKRAVSWGRLAQGPGTHVRAVTDRSAPLAPAVGCRMLPHGMGRSYGDVALNDGGVLLLTTGLDRLIEFDVERGRLRAEAGVTLDQILTLIVPRGWFLAVTPGTRFVSLGGAVANDVHGKNHHSAGSFGNHIESFELLRSDGERLPCSRSHNADWFRATVGGLGLTGLITWVEIRLTRIAGPGVWVSQRKFASLEEYWAVDADFAPVNDYTVAWVDCLHEARGIYSAGNFTGSAEPAPQRPTAVRRMPVDPPFSLVNGPSLRLFNFLYYRRPVAKQSLVHYQPFFYPLDALRDWNRIYGRRGFFQYQCVLPPDTMRPASAELFRIIKRSGRGSFLAVFKTFGSAPPAGLLSFARPGATLALDFPRGDAKTLRLFDDLDAVVREARGALYCAKDARMPGWMFELSHPGLEEFIPFVDPAFSSNLWQRVRA